MMTQREYGMLGCHHYCDIRHNQDGRVISSTPRPHFTPREISSYSFLLQAEWCTPGILVAGRRNRVTVNCTLAQALRLCTGRRAHRESRSLLIHDDGTRRWWWFSVTPRPLFTPVKDAVPILQETEWAPGPVWTGAEKLTSPGIWYLDRAARCQSLYRLRYPADVLTFIATD